MGGETVKPVRESQKWKEEIEQNSDLGTRDGLQAQMEASAMERRNGNIGGNEKTIKKRRHTDRWGDVKIVARLTLNDVKFSQ